MNGFPPDNPLDLAQLRHALKAFADAPGWRVALSGGVDSCVLLHLLARLCERAPGLPPLGAIHVNHHLQPGADEWAAHCERVCRELDLPLEVLDVSVEVDGRGLEAAARESRYRALAGAMGQGEILMTGHHQDDQVETFLLRLLRGAGVDGLGAMAAARPLGPGHLLRPLISCARSELAHYAREHHLSYIDDPSNRDTGLDRNYLRHRVLPLLEARWPGYRTTVSRAARHVRETATELRRLVPAVPPCRSVAGDPGLELPPLLAEPDSLACVVLRDWVRGLGGAVPEAARLAEFLRQLREAGAGRAPRLACGGLELRRFREAVYALPGQATFVSPGPLAFTPDQTLELPGVGRVMLKPVSGPGLALADGQSLELRWRGGGERCQPRGRRSRRSLKKLLQEAGLPPWWRDRVPLLYRGDKLLAVGDLWLCEGAPLQREGGWQLFWTRKTAVARD